MLVIHAFTFIPSLHSNYLPFPPVKIGSKNYEDQNSFAAFVLIKCFYSFLNGENIKIKAVL
jgi:hypothetical protein